MTNYNYNGGIPAANNNPSVDQNPMLENFTSINQIIGVDHVTFNTNNGGQHLQVTYTGTATPSVPADPMAIAFTKNDSGGHPNNYFTNSQSTFLMTGIKAFGSFTTVASAGTVTAINSYNVASISFSGSPNNTYTVTLNSNVVNGNNVVIQISRSNTLLNIGSYTFANPVLTISGAPANYIISFMILQA